MLLAIKPNKISACSFCLLSKEKSSTMHNEMALVWGRTLKSKGWLCVDDKEHIIDQQFETTVGKSEGRQLVR